MMQHAYKSIALPVADYARLQRLMLTMIGSRTALASMLRRKLGSARAVSSAIARGVATSGTRVGFRIDGQRYENRILTWHPAKGENPANISLLSPRGLALLGLTPGESISYCTEGDRTEFLAVEHVSAAETPRASRAAAASPRAAPHTASIQFTAPEGAFSGGQNG